MNKPTNMIRMDEPFMCYGDRGQSNAIEVEYDPRRQKGSRIMLTICGESITLTRARALALSAALNVAAGCYTPEQDRAATGPEGSKP